MILIIIHHPLGLPSLTVLPDGVISFSGTVVWSNLGNWLCDISIAIANIINGWDTVLNIIINYSRDIPNIHIINHCQRGEETRRNQLIITGAAPQYPSDPSRMAMELGKSWSTMDLNGCFHI